MGVKSDIGRFAIVPEWLLDSEISPQAIRLYAVLAAKYTDKDGQGHPSRSALAGALQASLDTVDRALGELTAIRAVVVERRADERGRAPSDYDVRFSRLTVGADAADPSRPDAENPGAPTRTPSRADAATVTKEVPIEVPIEVRAAAAACPPKVSTEHQAMVKEAQQLWLAERTRHRQRSGEAFARFTDPKALRNLGTACLRATSEGEWQDVLAAIRVHAAGPKANPWYLDEWTREQAGLRRQAEQTQRKMTEREGELGRGGLRPIGNTARALVASLR